MARFNKRKSQWSKDKKKTSDGSDRREGYKKIDRNNALFEAYYRAQGLCEDEEEWTAFFDTLRVVLPTTLRITAFRQEAEGLRETMRKASDMHINIPTDSSDEPVTTLPPPTPMPWYPNDLAWTVHSSRAVIKRVPQFKRLHNFLVAESEVGNMTRQEAVSMIPPLLLDVQPHHWVIDMCAAPGSKTTQLIEALHASDPQAPKDAVPSGLILANDANGKRSYMLVHHTRRLQSPALVITNHEAQFFPNIRLSGSGPGPAPILQFDRVLCDVPCSGDGTLRKNEKIWQTWTINDAYGLHALQIRILERGAQLCRVGGRIVYSTCSMNPIENEAVIAQVLRQANGALALVDVSDQLPKLIRRPGLSSWKVMDGQGGVLDSYAPDRPKDKSTPSCYSPSEEEAGRMHLDRCIRIYPHLQDTGAFFVAVLSKVSPMTAADRNGVEEEKVEATEEDVVTTKEGANPTKDKVEITEEESSKASTIIPVKRPAENDQDQPRTREKKTGRGAMPKEEPFIMLDPNQPEIKDITDFYGISPDLPTSQYLVRAEDGTHKTLYFVSPAVKSLLQARDVERLKLINTGTKAFVRNDVKNIDAFPFRIQADGLPLLTPFLGPQRFVDAAFSDVLTLIREANPKFDSLSEPMATKLRAMRAGCVILRLDPAQMNEAGKGLKYPLLMPLWRANVSVNLLISKIEIRALVTRLDLDIEIGEGAKGKGHAKTEEEAKAEEEAKPEESS
ncbi:S-adenosyl-L-methionine-dependent methyltransferase [Piptocephalis cylindrospora]|uniref:S-adenosyl-L-methionine-dependent methyltransferase n=1 Tax=Piptocephalis cylindrospora TaxID=1907219 RepID=A0A4P9Y8Z0_9FUNG|nr:S-adenosyl-L-methionine-dependent methyltransferase [Piptocephalis cylindrospora]|eukprot:RKP14861.1 S-adenosyl-L-methionine-dependent methyltransferase [Piptocephalis cylindrospora]